MIWVGTVPLSLSIHLPAFPAMCQLESWSISKLHQNPPNDKSLPFSQPDSEPWDNRRNRTHSENTVDDDSVLWVQSIFAHGLIAQRVCISVSRVKPHAERTTCSSVSPQIKPLRSTQSRNVLVIRNPLRSFGKTHKEKSKTPWQNEVSVSTVQHKSRNPVLC